jgi:cytoskeleton protein RodZ
MSESTGNRLRKQRLSRGLSLQDVSQATKIRPEHLAALESDDFSQFPSHAYGRGFLTLYGKHLGVDVTQKAASLEGHSAVNNRRYQYLENAPLPPLPEDSIAPRERAPSVVPLVIFGALLLFAAAGLWLLITAKRLGIH